MSGPAFDPDWCIAPGATLRDWCDEHSVTFEEAAEACRHMKLDTFEGIVRGDTEITPVLAGALQAGTGILARFWLNFEDNYRAALKAGKKDMT